MKDRIVVCVAGGRRVWLAAGSECIVNHAITQQKVSSCRYPSRRVDMPDRAAGPILWRRPGTPLDDDFRPVVNASPNRNPRPRCSFSSRVSTTRLLNSASRRRVYKFLCHSPFTSVHNRILKNKKSEKERVCRFVDSRLGKGYKLTGEGRHVVLKVSFSEYRAQKIIACCWSSPIVRRALLDRRPRGKMALAAWTHGPANDDNTPVPPNGDPAVTARGGIGISAAPLLKTAT